MKDLQHEAGSREAILSLTGVDIKNDPAGEDPTSAT
jgi:hypothetical protein